ncbi:hypothetical protein PPL_08746 [Heterostelium album PN500]|uniref:Monalysin Pore-forming domain-containing protein n=1 Tax=Heterostelium pallidum (strain ATCC 26659 / Pp 5 / PN500) TaxID=670386 RepID=D3BJL8_HETP5|nr:hypothetical protein PPL_08746 [Heterostelium album PN500]EFA78098.1 hypothetical protein PPL_08746 [Heterostelium album PN500]|eukprot:XP_020430225.1 hypothetical protein PPL_08746 [Heterostelium album PN500]
MDVDTIKNLIKNSTVTSNEKNIKKDSGHDLCVQESLKPYQLSSCPNAINDDQITCLSKQKAIPEVVMILQNIDWTPYRDYPYLLLDLLSNPTDIRTRCKPVASYSEIIDSKVINRNDRYTFTQKKGTLTTESWFEGTTTEVGVAIEIFDGCAPVTTGYFYYKSISQENLKWKEMMKVGHYLFYQNKVLYVFQMEFPSLSVSQIEKVAECFNLCHQYQCLVPKVYFRGRSLFYFVDMYKDEPFYKLYSDQLYQTCSKEEIIDYLLGDGYNRW